MARFRNGKSIESPLPWNFTGYTSRNYVVTGNWNNLQTVTDYFLNLPGSPILFRALGDLVYVQVNTYDQIVSVPHAYQGFVQSSELCVIFPVLQGSKIKKKFLPLKKKPPKYFCPYVFVADPWSLVSVRSLIGFFGQLGEFRIPPVDRRRRTTVKAMVYPEYSPATRAVRKRVLRVEPQKGRKRHGYQSIPDYLSQHQAGYLKGGDVPRGPTRKRWKAAFEAIDPEVSDNVTLKQLRAVQDCDPGAAYQAIVNAQLTYVTRATGGLGPADVEFKPYASLDIPRDLGLENPQNTKKTFWFECEATLGNGEVLYTSS